MFDTVDSLQGFARIIQRLSLDRVAHPVEIYNLKSSSSVVMRRISFRVVSSCCC